MILALLSCMAEQPEIEERKAVPTFLRDAILENGTGDFWSRYRPLSWQAGATVQWADENLVSPQQASCLTVFQVPLGNVNRLAAAGVEANTDVVFSPDEKLLAVGTQLGDVWVVDAFSGEVRAQKSFSEGMIKWLRWSSDGQILYAAEQSPDAYVYALNATDLSPQWTLRLADFVQSSPLPAGEDVYGMYSLPAAYALDVLDNGTLLVAAAHSWGPFGTGRQNQSQLLLLSAEGAILKKWPEQPADVIIKHLRLNQSQSELAVVISRSADGAQISSIPDGGVQILSLPTLAELKHLEVPPLEPYFSTADVWEAFDIEERLFMGLVDGRVLSFDSGGEQEWVIEPSTPLNAGDVPIHSSIGWGHWLGEQAIFTTSVTYIPFGASVPDQQPPMPHPQANSLLAVDASGHELWRWQSAPIIQGLSIRTDGKEILIGGGRRNGDARRDAYGGYVIDSAPDVSSRQRLRAHCPTESPVFFRHAIASDGRVALIEIPTKTADDRIWGQYRLTVMR